MPSRPTHDPRAIVTPDAFEVSPQLLGMPLARPGRRLAALVIDLALIGAIYLLTRSFALILGVAAAAFFIRAGFKRTQVRGSAFNRAMRLSVGCLGVWIGLITTGLWVVFGWDLSLGGDRSAESPVVIGVDAPDVEAALPLSGILSSLGDLRALQSADSAQAEEILRQFAQRLGDAQVGDADLGALLSSLVPEGAEWAGRSDAIIARALSRGGPAPGATADTLRALESRIETLEGDRLRTEQELAATRRQLEEARSGGALLTRFRELVDELGFGFGWAALYMTVLLSWWKGQTVGKKILRLRVVRLDGEPITWWVAFERAGGYAAGFATGLLGFAQVYWDANRQAIHDRIVGTVVLDERFGRVPDWENVL